jgi:uncharacterized membrane protein
MRADMTHTLKALALLSLGICFVLVHALAAASSWSQADAMVGALQLSVLFALVAARFPWRHKWWLALAVMVLLVVAAFRAGDHSLLTVAGIPHAIAFFLLLLLFGETLRPGHEAFITARVRKLQDPLPGNVAAYTRNITWAWCFFFASQLVVSLVLFFGFSEETWSYFVTNFNLPLVAAMFAGEYLCRVIYVRNRPRATWSTMIRAFSYVPAPENNES